MPQVTADPLLKRQMLDILKEEYSLGAQREGIHVSDLTGCLTKRYWAREDPAQPSDTEIGLWSVGWGMERTMISRMHVEPFEVDGITMSLDFQLPDGTIADLKTTRMAPQGRKGEGGFQMPESWLKQFAAYRYGWNARCSDEQVDAFDPMPLSYGYDFGVVVVHLIPAEITTWRVTWTPQELNNLWTGMLERRDDLQRMLDTNQPEPFKHNLGAWECTNCSRSLACGLVASIEGLK